MTSRKYSRDAITPPSSRQQRKIEQLNQRAAERREAAEKGDLFHGAGWAFAAGLTIGIFLVAWAFLFGMPWQHESDSFDIASVAPDPTTTLTYEVETGRITGYETAFGVLYFRANWNGNTTAQAIDYVTYPIDKNANLTFAERGTGANSSYYYTGSIDEYFDAYNTQQLRVDGEPSLTKIHEIVEPMFADKLASLPKMEIGPNGRQITVEDQRIAGMYADGVSANDAFAAIFGRTTATAEYDFGCIRKDAAVINEEAIQEAIKGDPHITWDAPNSLSSSTIDEQTEIPCGVGELPDYRPPSTPPPTGGSVAGDTVSPTVDNNTPPSGW